MPLGCCLSVAELTLHHATAAHALQQCTLRSILKGHPWCVPVRMPQQAGAPAGNKATRTAAPRHGMAAACRLQERNAALDLLNVHEVLLTMFGLQSAPQFRPPALKAPLCVVRLPPRQPRCRC